MRAGPVTWFGELSRWRAEVRADRRQRRYPAEWRIAREDVLNADDLRPRVVAAIERLAAGGGATRHGGPEEGALVDSVTSLWRARRRITASNGDQPVHPLLRRNVEASWRAMHEAGITVQEHDGKPYDPGQALDAIAMEPRAGLARETIVDTVRPTVYINGRHVQMGQVIVGLPEGET